MKTYYILFDGQKIVRRPSRRPCAYAVIGTRREHRYYAYYEHNEEERKRQVEKGKKDGAFMPRVLRWSSSEDVAKRAIEAYGAYNTNLFYVPVCVEEQVEPREH